MAIPYRGLDLGAELNSKIIQHMIQHPMWFAPKLDAEEVRLNAVWMLNNREYHKWEVWDGGQLVGMLLLNRIVAPVDALFHFTFFEKRSLFAARKLIANFLAFAFRQYGLRRISMEIPEHIPTMVRFARQKLGFKYEGELDLERFQKLRIHVTTENDALRAQFALYGSRREGAHWNPKTDTWSDVVLLRLVREEIEPRASSDMTTRESLNTEDSNVVRREPGNPENATKAQVRQAGDAS